MKTKVTPEQIQDWTENPVTEFLSALVEDELQDIIETPVSECYYPGEPFKTQDNVSDLNTRHVVWQVFSDLLKGDWTYLEVDNEEHIGD